MFHNIPHEMRNYRQWIVWRYEDVGGKKPSKIPYNARTGYPADVTDPADWSTFDEAVSVAWSGNYSGLGFVFSKHDPFTGIDLDDAYEKNELGAYIHADPAKILDMQQKICAEFHSYTERSPSGKGVHIIVKGAVASGRRRSSVEVYSDGRYFTMTGNVYKDLPIVDRNELLQTLWGEMAKGAEVVNYYDGDMAQTLEDSQVMEAAAKAQNGEKFTNLFNGHWQQYYSSQSEADFALIDIIAHYTKYKFQILRLFQNSALGQRDKAKRGDYITRMINKSFDRMLPPVDFSNILNDFNDAKARAEAATVSHSPASPSPAPDAGTLPPPLASAAQDAQTASGAQTLPFGIDVNAWRTAPTGLIGAIAEFIYKQSPRPVYEISLTGTLGILSGIVGRAYNISGTGLNHYILALAPTGTGKEAISSGSEKLVQAVARKVPHAVEVIGPADLASGQALLKHLSKRAIPCFVTITGEFGLRMKMISQANANAADIALRRVLLDLYNKSGAGQTVRPTVYSDTTNNTETIHSPSFSLIGESVPERFYEALDESMIYEGLLPRFTIIEYNGIRVPNNESAWLVQPSEQLIDGVEKLILNAHDCMANGRTVPISIEPSAGELLRGLDQYADWQINTNSQDTLRQLWNRFHVKILKMAGLLAISDNFYQPTVSVRHVHWAASLMAHDVTALTKRFVNGDIGQANGEMDRINAVKSAIREYLTQPFARLKNGARRELHDAKLIHRAYIQRRCLSTNCFMNAGGTRALNDVINNMIGNGVLTRVSIQQLQTVSKFSGETYAPLDMDYFVNDG